MVIFFVCVHRRMTGLVLGMGRVRRAPSPVPKQYVFAFSLSVKLVLAKSLSEDFVQQNMAVYVTQVMLQKEKLSDISIESHTTERQ